MRENKELEELADELKKIFDEVFKKLRGKKLNDRTLDNEVFNVLQNCKISKDNLKIEFSEPQDSIYKAESGRTPYDLLCFGEINGKKFKIFINNKFGDIDSNTRNDITTYNNLFRLYLGITKQRVTSKITIDSKLIYKRVSGEEIISYAVFVVDKDKNKANFFLLEEIDDNFYVNPRNNMFQVKYKPKLRKPRDYFAFVIELIDSILKSLQKSLNTTQTEIIAINGIKQELIEIKNGFSI